MPATAGSSNCMFLEPCRQSPVLPVGLMAVKETSWLLHSQSGILDFWSVSGAKGSCGMHRQHEDQMVPTQIGHPTQQRGCMWIDKTFCTSPPGWYGTGNYKPPSNLAWKSGGILRPGSATTWEGLDYQPGDLGPNWPQNQEPAPDQPEEKLGILVSGPFVVKTLALYVWKLLLGTEIWGYLNTPCSHVHWPIEALKSKHLSMDGNFTDPPSL